MPAIPSTFPELRTLTETELENLLNDPDCFQKFLYSMKPVESVRKLREELRESNAKQAAQTLDLDSNGTKAQAEVESLQKQLQDSATTYQRKLEELEKEYGATPESTLSQIKTKRDALDDRSEDIAQNFVRGEGKLPTLTTEYRNQRQEYYTLKNQMECLNSIKG
jgi:chromosome segregation ATPase